MAKLKLNVILDQCLGKLVFRGSAPANELVPACWIDFHDLDRNQYGYQRPFDKKRSLMAADYAEKTPDAFWPECILAIRDNEEVEEEKDKVNWEYKEFPGTNGKYGELVIEYNETNMENIAGENVPWRRAFSQVDCQHRLGNMMSSSKSVTFCCFTNIKRAEEAIIFRTINDKQKKISTSLVDAIIKISDQNCPIPIKWAWDLGHDTGSAFNRLVATGGRNLEPPTRLVTLRTLQMCVKQTIPPKFWDGGETGYIFLRNFWNTVKLMWPTEFSDPKNYKLMTVPGLRGLARFGRRIFLNAIDTQDVRESIIQAAFNNDPSQIDWIAHGPFRDASGNAGIRIIYEALMKAYP